MKTSIECIPCLIHQAIDMLKMLSDDSHDHERIVLDILHLFGEMKLPHSPPALAQRIHRLLKEACGALDLYENEKKCQNELVMGFLPGFRDRILSASDPVITAVRFAIAGNVIDLGANRGFAVGDIKKSVESSLTEAFFGDREAFRDSVENARSILYLADNAGEIAFDRLLIEQLSPQKVTLVVRGAPVLNDATLTDAIAVGLDEIVDIIDNGSDAPGTLLDDCSPEFLRRYEDADLIIAKGQGNYESLSNEDRNIFFLFKVKCRVIAAHAGRPIGSHLLAGTDTGRRHSNGPGFFPGGDIDRMPAGADHF